MKELRLTAGEDLDMGSWVEAGLCIEARDSTPIFIG